MGISGVGLLRVGNFVGMGLRGGSFLLDTGVFE